MNHDYSLQSAFILKLLLFFIDLLQAKLEDEMKIMQCMDYHTHIVNLQGFKINQPDPTFSMVLEYCSKGSLFNYLGKYCRYTHIALFL